MKKTSFQPFILPLLALATAGCALLGIRYGSASLTFSQVFAGLLHPGSTDPAARIIWVVRLPHVVACLLAGWGLAVSGVLLQCATGNPLAGPNIIGVNAGAGFAMVLGMCLFPMSYRLFPVMAFLGAFCCALLIVFLANRAGGGKVTVVLAGVAVSALLSAGISLLKLRYPDLAVAYNYFSIGGVSGVGFDDLLVPGCIIAAATVSAALLASKLNLLCLGDALAGALGLRVKLLRCTALLLASAAAGAAVSFAGLLGFVGLMVPHIAGKLLDSQDLRRRIPASVLLGGSLVVLSDLVGRVAFAPSEIPAGIITAILGAPFFFLLLMQRRNRL